MEGEIIVTMIIIATTIIVIILITSIASTHIMPCLGLNEGPPIPNPGSCMGGVALILWRHLFNATMRGLALINHCNAFWINLPIVMSNPFKSAHSTGAMNLWPTHRFRGKVEDPHT